MFTLHAVNVWLFTIFKIKVKGSSMSADVASASNQLNKAAILLVLALGTFILGLSEFSMMPMPVSYTHLTLPTICSV